MDTIRLNSDAEVRIFPDAIVVFNFSDGDGGFRVTSLPPSPRHTEFFTDRG